MRLRVKFLSVDGRVRTIKQWSPVLLITNLYILYVLHLILSPNERVTVKSALKHSLKSKWIKYLTKTSV